MVELAVPGGPSVHVSGLAEALAGMGHRVHLLVPRCARAVWPRNVEVHGIPLEASRPRGCGPIRSWRRSSWPGFAGKYGRISQ